MALKILAFVVPLGFDTFAVAVALGLRGFPLLLPALVFALFEALMPLIGLVLGRLLGERFETAAVVAGGFVLIGVGGFLLRETRAGENEADNLSFSSVRLAAMAGLAISMDELAIGFPMGALRLPIPAVIAAIAAQAFVVTLVGVSLGRRIGAGFGARASAIAAIAAAIAFIVLGVYLIAERFVPGLPML